MYKFKSVCILSVLILSLEVFANDDLSVQFCTISSDVAMDAAQRLSHSNSIDLSSAKKVRAEMVGEFLNRVPSDLNERMLLVTGADEWVRFGLCEELKTKSKDVKNLNVIKINAFNTCMSIVKTKNNIPIGSCMK